MTKFPRVVVAALLCAGAACFFSLSKAADGDKPADAAKAPANTDKPAADVKTELKALIGKINSKLEAGKKAEADFADEIKQFDVILDEHKGDKDASDDIADLLGAKAELYGMVFQDTDKAIAIYKTLQADYPDTRPGMGAGRMINQIKAAADFKKEQDAMIGTVFPDFDAKDLDGKSISAANYKGKVVMIDFWATWCPPCRAEMPNVIKTYEKYHDKGFEIIGISGDQTSDVVKTFIAQNNMPWPQILDGVDNTLGKKYDAKLIPTNILIGKDGKILSVGLRGDDLYDAVGKAVAQ